MESLLNRLTAASEDPEELWSDLEDLNEGQLESLTKQVTSLGKKVKKSKAEVVQEDSEDQEESAEEDEEGSFDEECEEEDGSFDKDGDGEEDGSEFDEDGEDEDDIDMENFDELDPKEQLRLLMRPVKDEAGLSDDDEDEEDGDEDFDLDQAEDDDDEAEEGGRPSKKGKYDILGENADSEDEASVARPMSNFEKQQARLQRSIAAMEAENVEKKDWTLRGEVAATARPSESLLQEDLEFEHVAKLAPTITEEVTESLEDLIRKRVKDQAWDDVERIPEEMMLQDQKRKQQIQLDDSKAKLSLAEQYEVSFQQKQEAEARKSKSTDLKDEGPVDPETKKQHDEIRKFFGKMCKSLDELSENKFAPRAYELAEVEIKTIKK